MHENAGSTRLLAEVKVPASITIITILSTDQIARSIQCLFLWWVWAQCVRLMNDQRESDDEGFGERKKANSVRRSGRSGRAASGVERRVSRQRAMKYTLDSLTASAPEGPAEIGANYRCHLTFRTAHLPRTGCTASTQVFPHEKHPARRLWEAEGRRHFATYPEKLSTMTISCYFGDMAKWRR